MGPSGFLGSGSHSGSVSSWFPAMRPGYSILNGTYHRDLGFVCPAQFRTPKGLDYVIRVGGKVVHDCGIPCKGMFFTEEEAKFSRIWVGVWGSICMVSCLFTVSLTTIFKNRTGCLLSIIRNQPGPHLLTRCPPFPLPRATCGFSFCVLLYGSFGLCHRLCNG